MLHLLAGTGGVRHLLQLLAALAVLQHRPQLLLREYLLAVLLTAFAEGLLEKPELSFEVDICKDIRHLPSNEDLPPLLLEDGHLFADLLVIDRVDCFLYFVKHKLLHCDPAVGHDLLHLLPAQVEVFVEVVDDLADDYPEWRSKYIAFFIGMGIVGTDF